MSGHLHNLHEILNEKEPYTHGLISTFTFDADFFESYVLERFRVPRRCSHLTIYMDQGQYDELAADMLRPGADSHHGANRRYLLHPISVHGVFHPKILLFASATSGLLIIGSANLTQDGLSSNAELVSIFHYRSGSSEAALPLFQQAFAFFTALQHRWPGERAAGNLHSMAEEAPWLQQPLPSTPLQPVPPVLLHNLDQPLWTQIAARLPGPVEELWAVSRFFDEAPTALEHLTAPLGHPRLRIHTAPAIHTMSPSWLDHPMARDRRMEIRFCQYGPSLQPQRLHGKAYAFFGTDWAALACGSANFSHPALLQTAPAGNVETLLLHHATGGDTRHAVSHLFDPAGDGRPITHASQFGPREDTVEDPVNRTRPSAVRIIEAWLEEETLTIRLASTPPARARCLLTQTNYGSFPLDIPAGAGEQFRISLTADAARRIHARPTIIRLADPTTDTPLSNPAIIAALLNEAALLETRSQRRAREAEESPAQFMAILQDLCASEDESRLIDHLSRCDIAIVQDLHPVRPPPDGGREGGGRPPRTGYGDRTFRQFEILHDAVMDFCRRHRRRLESHAEEGTVSGVRNYFHILETLLLLLHSQVERATVGLEHRATQESPPEPLTPTRWKDARDNLTAYYDEMASLLKLTTREYVRHLRQSSPDSIVKEHFGKTPDDILRICTDTLLLQKRLLLLQHGPLRILSERGDHVPIHFAKTRINSHHWPAYVESIKAVYKELRQWTHTPITGVA